jgi:heme/copper-type cytochrome/quinol oxidase subunit 1
MQKLSRQILIELLWLTLSFGLTILLAFFLLGWSFSQKTIDIHLHDTIFVISCWYILIPFFFLVTFIAFFIKAFRNTFNRALSNWILIITGLVLVIALTFLIKTFSQFFTGGWTLYPPLSALGPNKVPELKQDLVTKIVTNFFTAIQIVVLTLLLFVTYRWGAKRKKASSE